MDCDNCGETMIRVIGAPTVLRHSFQDGYKRDGAYYLNKEAAKLESKMFNMPVEERKEAKKEVQNLKRATGAEKPKGGR